MAEKGDEQRSPEKEDYSYIRTAVTLGNVDFIKDLVPHLVHDKATITNYILVPAAMYGQLELLECALHYGKRVEYFSKS